MEPVDQGFEFSSPKMGIIPALSLSLSLKTESFWISVLLARVFQIRNVGSVGGRLKVSNLRGTLAYT